MVLGELHAGLADRVDAVDLLGQGVEDQVAPGLLPVREDLQQDQAAEPGVEDLCVVERLVGVIDRLAPDALSALGVVLDLDRQVAADRLDENLVEDGNVWVTAAAVVLPRRDRPLEIVRRRIDVVALSTVVDIGRVSFGIDSPAKDLDITERGADLEDGEELAVGQPAEQQQAGVLVILAQLLEIADEPRIVQEVARRARGQRRELQSCLPVRPLAGHERIEAEDVRDLDRALEAQEDVVAEEQLVADAGDVARHAVVLGADALAADHGHLAAAEQLEAAGVQRIDLLPELARLDEQTVADDLVRAAVDLRRLGLCYGHGRLPLKSDLDRCPAPWPAPGACSARPCAGRCSWTSAATGRRRASGSGRPGR